jgi:hypothetical protein
MGRLFFSSMFIIMIASLAIRAGAFPEEGLVLHLSFDKDTIEGDEVEDLSGQGNNGIINGSAEVDVGKFGEALLFDGVDDFVEVPLSDSITFTEGSSFTVQAWVKTDDSPTQNDGIVGNYRQSTQAFWNLSVSGDDAAQRGKMGFNIRDVGKVHYSGISSPDFLNDGQWHHLAGVRDQDQKKARFYVDGVLIDEIDDQTEDINSGQSIWIGEHLDRFYKGLIDDVKVWNRALSAAELDRSRSGVTAVNPSSKLATLWGSVKISDQ